MWKLLLSPPKAKSPRGASRSQDFFRFWSQKSPQKNIKKSAQNGAYRSNSVVSTRSTCFFAYQRNAAGTGFQIFIFTVVYSPYPPLTWQSENIFRNWLLEKTTRGMSANTWLLHWSCFCDLEQLLWHWGWMKITWMFEDVLAECLKRLFTTSNQEMLVHLIKSGLHPDLKWVPHHNVKSFWQS